jgi:hypothetical protein
MDNFLRYPRLIFLQSVARSHKPLKKERKCKMSYEEKWKVLADLLIDLQKRGEKIPADVMRDLRSAKTIIQVLKADPTHIENLSRIDTYLRNVESYAIFTAEKHGTENVEKWLKKLETEKIGTNKKEKAAASRFIPGVPRDKKWVRIQTSEDTPADEIKKLVEASGLSYKMQKKGYMFVYGNGENIKSFMNRMTKRFRGTRNG